MLIENKEKRKIISKWIIGIFVACILIYLGIRYVSVVAYAISWLMDLVFPLLLGIILALIFNVPMKPIEKWLLSINKSSKMKKASRPLAIVLSFFVIFGIFIGIAVLVVPEVVSAVKIVIENIMLAIDQLVKLEESTDLSEVPFGEIFAKIDIDWIQMKTQLEQWAKNISDQLMNIVASGVGSVAGSIVDFIVAITFSIYILSGKEKLKRQVKHLIYVWIPENVGNNFLHVASVCNQTFQSFVIGQVTEAIILGSLCAIGMLILRLPYAPMIGALVGVTALLPIVGAYIGAIVGAFMILTVNPFKAFVFIIFLLILQQIEGNLIYPRVVGSKINLPAIWVLAAITIGGNLAGPVGMLFAVPIMSSAYILLKEATEKKENKVSLNEK